MEQQGKTIQTGLIAILVVGLLITGFCIGMLFSMTQINAKCVTTGPQTIIFNESNLYNQNFVIPPNLTGIEVLNYS